MKKSMDFSLLKIKGFNALLYLMVGFQFAALAGIVAFFISSFSNGSVSFPTAASAVFMLILGIPLLFMLYRSNEDAVLKNIFLGLLGTFTILTISGFLGYVAAPSLGYTWLESASKLVMICSYPPFFYVLFRLLMSVHRKIPRNIKAFILFVNVSSALFILYFALADFQASLDLNIALYTISTMVDISLLAVMAILIAFYTPTKVRYILAISFSVFLFSFIADAMNLAVNLGFASISKYPWIFYDLMLVVFVAGLLIYSFLSNIRSTTVEEVNKKLDDTQHIMDDILMQFPMAICVFNMEGDVILANDILFKVFNADRSQVIRKFNLFKQVEALNSQFKSGISRVRKGETIIIDRVNISVSPEHSKYISFKIFPTHDSEGSLSGIVAICEDVTSGVRAEEELKQAKELVELYIDLMGHDINNMNQVGMGYLEIALDTMKLDEENTSFLVKPLEAMKNSSKLIDNVKKLRRANADDLGLSQVDLGKVITDVVGEHSQAPGREVSIDYEISNNAYVYANQLLKDVFLNLVNNAIKHSKGPIKISIRQEPFEKNGKKYHRITVEDDGPGISDELKPIIFDRLQRGRNKVGGSGIGLYLVKTLVDNYNGTITVEDRIPGQRQKGSRFVVMLPAADVAVGEPKLSEGNLS